VRKNLIFRLWFYFRQGWGTYFAFIFAAVNTMVVTYYLAIEKVPTLKEIFPSFASYLLIMMTIGIPLLVAIGYIHFKKIPAFSSEVDVSVVSNPYVYRAQPGWQIEVIFPLYGLLANYLVKLSKNEKLTEEELNELEEIRKKIDILLRGGPVGKNLPKSLDHLKD